MNDEKDLKELIDFLREVLYDYDFTLWNGTTLQLSFHDGDVTISVI